MKGETGDFKLLVAGAAAGDQEAFERLVRGFRNLAFGYAYSILGDFQLAEDVTQEAFLEAHRQLRKLRHPAAFPGWLRLIVFKHADRITRRATVPVVPLDGAPEAAARGAGPEELAERREAREKILGAVRELPEALRTATVLFYIGGHSSSEVSRYLEVPLTTVKKRLHDARQLLKEMTMDRTERSLKDRALPESFAGRLLRFPFPLREPEVQVTDCPDERMDVLCTDAQSYFVPLSEGGRCDWTFYDRPGHRLTGVYEYRVVDGVKWGDGRLIRAWSRFTDLGKNAPAEWKEECFAVSRDACRRVSVARDTGGKVKLSGYMWPGEPHEEAKPELMRLSIGVKRRGYEPNEVTGVCRVRVGEREWKCLKVVTAAQSSKSRTGEPAVYAEWYVAKTGRTVFFRRYNGPGWAKHTSPSSFESLKGAPEVRHHGIPYRHWYDCIPDIALGSTL
jgi:RNA polymerase sigma factor (sigma-70 family)